MWEAIAYTVGVVILWEMLKYSIRLLKDEYRRASKEV